MSEEAYIEGWRTGDAMTEIRLFRTEITLCAVHAAQSKKGVMSYREMEKSTLVELQKQFKFTPPASFVAKCMDNLVKQGQLLRSTEDADSIVKGPRW